MKVTLTIICQIIKKLVNRRHHNVDDYVGAATSLILMFIVGLVGMSLVGTSNVSAASSSLTMSIDDAVLDLDIIPHSANGDFAKSTNSTISVTTNNYSGYTLSIAASGSTNLIGDDGSIVSISSAVSESDFSADNTTAANNYNGKWGYLPSKLNSTNNTAFQPSPGTDSDGHTLDVTNTANTNNTPNTYTLAIGARVDNTTAPGSYSNTFVITAIANAVPYTITYNQNTTDTVSNMPANITNGTTYADAVSLSSTTPTRTGYDFNGWCTVQVADGATCTGTTYAAGDTWTIDQTAGSNSLTIYAMWKQSKLYFQDATLEDCGQTMYDNRGTDAYKNVAYTTATINDLCWMTRNLDLPGGTTLTSDDTNLTTGFTLPASSTSGFDDYDTDYVYNSNSTSCASNRPCYSYYSWYTATAHWGTRSVTSGSSSVDICPKGWRLPTQAEFNTLVSSYSTGATLTGSPFLGVYAGYYYDSSFVDGGSVGAYWSSTAYNSSSDAYTLDFDSSNAYVSSSFYKYCGDSIRCVMKDARTIADMEYMQDINAEIVQNTAEGATMTLKDKRDENTYTVAKINGQLWMTQNLRFTGTSVPTATSNVTANKTLTYYQLDTDGDASGERCNGSTGYSNACIKDSGSTTTGVWYNYYAATASTVSGSSNSTAASQDICPAGWRLPTNSEFSGITSYSSAFSPVTGGYYSNGSLYNTGNGDWWSATASSTTRRYHLNWNGSSLGTYAYYRYGGRYVRCVRS